MIGLLVFLFQVVDVQFRGIGKPWAVPWTAETILQVRLLIEVQN